MLYSLLRPLLFRLEPERAHGLSVAVLRALGATPGARHLLQRLFRSARAKPVDLFGLRFPNRVGLAAGYDKDGAAWRGLACLGFGHIEIGTITPQAQPGNDKPRVFRLTEDRSLINRMGFPSEGAAAVARRLAHRPTDGPLLGANLGKQKATPNDRAVEDYLSLMQVFAPLCDYLVVNISSPNTPGLRELQTASFLRNLLEPLVEERNRMRESLNKALPLLVKLSPDLDRHQLEEALEVIRDTTIDGVIATNTTLDRSGLRSRLATQSGGLSGATLTRKSTQFIREIREITEGALPIIAAGGITNARDAQEKLDAGASLVQLFTGMVYEGPGLVKRILDGIDC